MTTTTGATIHSISEGRAKPGRKRRVAQSIPRALRDAPALARRLRLRIREGDAAAMRQGVEAIKAWDAAIEEHGADDETVDAVATAQHVLRTAIAYAPAPTPEAALAKLDLARVWFTETDGADTSSTGWICALVLTLHAAVPALLTEKQA